MAPTSTSTPTLTPAAHRIRDAASELFYTQGIHAVGVELIAERAETTKKTLYDRFGSKEGLVVAYLQHRCEVWQQFVRDHLARSGSVGVDRVLEVLRALDIWMRTNDRGCAFGNAYAELAGTGHSGLAVITAEKVWIRELYTELAAEAGLSDPERTGTELAIIHEGAIVAGTAGGVSQAFEFAVNLAKQSLRRPV